MRLLLAIPVFAVSLLPFTTSLGIWFQHTATGKAKGLPRDEEIESKIKSDEILIKHHVIMQKKSKVTDVT